MRCRAPATCPKFKDALHNVPATTNPLGVKGAGEGGTTAAIAALMNAIADAIPGGAGAHIDMPATPAEDLGGVPERQAELIAERTIASEAMVSPPPGREGSGDCFNASA